MEGGQIVYPPNRPMDRMFWVCPEQNKSGHLVFIDVNEAGQFILGNSDYLSSWWVGWLLYYRKFEDARDNIIASSYLDETTVSDGKFIDEQHAVISADTGRLSIVKLNDCSGDGILQAKDTFCDSTRIQQLDLWKTNKKLVTCSENDITLWNSSGGLAPVHVYRNFHTDIVSSLSCKTSEDVFISGSYDKRVCLWDVRSETPATVINDMKMGAVTAVSFESNADNYIFLGSVTGSVGSIDTRKPGDKLVDKLQVFNDKIHRISSNVASNKLAVCADSNEVQILESRSGEINLIYKNTVHDDMVRGMAWHKGDLYSCGMDRSVFKHICV